VVEEGRIVKAEDISVSVVIPTYNRAGYLGQAVDSALAQQPFGGSLEVIVVDDGSTDDTQRTLSSFGDRIVYLRIPHSGIPAVARNAGLEAASGSYVGFLDSDDLWLPEKLRRQVAVLAGRPTIALVYGSCEYIEADGTRTGQLVWSPENLKSGDALAELLRHNFLSTPGVLVPTRLVRAVGGFNESRALVAREDYELWLRLAMRAPFHFNDGVVALVRVHDGNLNRTSDAEHVRRTVATYRSALRSTQRTARPLLLARLAEVHLARASERGLWHPSAWPLLARGAWFRARQRATEVAGDRRRERTIGRR